MTTKTGYLKRDRMERFNLKRGWFVTAWRIVSASGQDLVQPWSRTKAEARETAKALGITLIDGPDPITAYYTDRANGAHAAKAP